MFHYLAFSHRSNAKWASKLKMKEKKKSGRAGEEGGERGEDSFALSLPPRLERSNQGDILKQNFDPNTFRKVCFLIGVCNSTGRF